MYVHGRLAAASRGRPYPRDAHPRDSLSIQKPNLPASETIVLWQETYCWSCDSLFQYSHAPVNQALLLTPELPLSTQCGPSSLFFPFFLFSLSLSFSVLFSLPLRQVPLQESDLIQRRYPRKTAL